MALESINVGDSPDTNQSTTTRNTVEVEHSEEGSWIDTPIDGDFDESTVEIDLEVDSDDDDDDEVVIDDNNDETEDSSTTEEDDDNEVVEDKPVEKESRSQKRIRELVAQKNEERARVQKLQDENFELQKQMAITQNQTMETQKTLLEGSIQSLKAQLVQATDEGETQKAIDIQLQLNDAQTKLSKVSEYTPIDITKLESHQKDTENNYKNSSEVTMSEATQDWMEENPWFTNPSTSEEIERVEAAIVFSQKLERLGKSMEDPNFFVLIDEYLEKFDIALAQVSKNSVSSKQDSSEEPDVKKPTKQKKVVRQTVQGASRTPTSSNSKSSSTKKSPKKIKLTAEQARLARLFDMTPLEYWESLQKESEKTTRMTQIDIK